MPIFSYFRLFYLSPSLMLELDKWFNKVRTDQIRKLQDFYGQRFTPRLITKYFKGWRLDENDNYILETHFAYCEINIEIDAIVVRTRYLNEDFDTFTALPPKNLNDFIRACELCKIHLESKE